MHRDGWIVLAVGGLAVWYFYLRGHATGAAGLPAGVNPLGDLFNTGITAGAKGSSTDPGGTLLGSNIPMGPAGPPDTGNGGSSGTYGPTLPDGSLYTGKEIGGQTPPVVIIDHEPRPSDVLQ